MEKGKQIRKKKREIDVAKENLIAFSARQNIRKK
jgi:hypothetical protein